MTALPANDYDAVAYPSMAHPQTFAENLAIKGLLRGLAVAPPDRCRVLELGCGDGFNLMAMAAAFPASQYVGLDYAADAIARGRAIAEELGFGQIRLEAADIRALDALAPALGEFDYIIAHGVYSWVPPDVRDALFTIVGRLLAPHGVAFVSYLALPGAHQRELVRTIIRYHTRAEADPTERARQSRAILRTIAKGTTEDNHYTRWISDELALIEQHSDSSLFHDELSAFSAPMLLTEFLGHAAPHGLQFLSEAEYLIPVGKLLTEDARKSLQPLEANRVLLEQYLDFLEGRRFRQTLLCRTELGRTLEHGNLDRLHVAWAATTKQPDAPLDAAEPLEFRGPKDATLRARNPMEKAVLLELVAHRGVTRPFPALRDATRRRIETAGCAIAENFDHELRHYLLRANLPGLVELRWDRQPYAVTPPARPFAHPLARWALAHGGPTGYSYAGRFVEVNGALGRHLVSLLDGTRDRTALLAGMREFLAAQHTEARARGETAKLPPPDDPAIPEQLERSLRGLTGLGLFRRDDT